MSQPAKGRGPARTDHFQLRVLRFEKGQTIALRLLSVPTLHVQGEPRIGGCLTYFKSHTHYFDRANPAQGIKRQDLVWKGYVAAEAYEQRQNLWLPCVLEITEHMELDLRGEPLRGQVWSVTRPHPTKKAKHPPMIATWLEDRDPDSFPVPFDMQPTLRILYHTDQVLLDVPNGLPARPMVLPSQGEPPPGYVPLSDDSAGAAKAPRPSKAHRFDASEAINGIGVARVDAFPTKEEQDRKAACESLAERFRRGEIGNNGRNGVAK